ncbi:hypothetical protein F4821DRAFT_108843 [Hypoxylon rubiginosum]|uniref:Uncharacterized protein n=1 Tax=Hypoxylon rubiginosum TaxID=110542 RepID=A0ACC0DIL5_9PEZI|nr:hypothetical protein F4821DRAFT_108843 [Hypoxylon rubiginosum]
MSYPYNSSNTTENTQYGSVFSATPSGYSDHTVATQYTVAEEDNYNNFVYNPPAGTVILPCEFVGLGSCDQAFEFDRTEEWIEHIITAHLHDRLPSKAICWFCDDFVFDARVTAQGDRRMNFQFRMEHIRGHIADGKTANDIRPDFHMLEHLRAHRLISDRMYNEVRKWCEVPCGNNGTAHIQPPNFIPPERQAQSYHDSKVVDRPERRHRHREGHRHRSVR